MSCKCSIFDSDLLRFKCTVSGDSCTYLITYSKVCAIDYGEGEEVTEDNMEGVCVK